MERIGDWAFERFIVFGERSVGKSSQRAEYSANALRIHDERAHVIPRGRICLEVGNVIAHPAVRGLVPPDLFAVGIPRLARKIARGAAIQNATVRRPRPCPILIEPQTRWIIRAATGELRSCLRPTSGIDPIPARSRSVVFQPSEARQLLTGLDNLLC